MEKEVREKRVRDKWHAKAIVRDLNLDSIRCFLSDAMEETEGIAWAAEDDDLISECLDENVDDAAEFKAAFRILSSDLERMYEDLNGNDWVPECFDVFFGSIGSHGIGDMMAYDEDEGDYFGISNSLTYYYAQDEQKKIMSLTKKEIMEAAGQCMAIAVSYMGLKARYDDLSSAMALIRGKNGDAIDEVKKVCQAYENLMKAREETHGYFEYTNENKEMDRLLEKLPDECWLK